MAEGFPNGKSEEKPNPFKEYLNKTPEEGGLDTASLEESYPTNADTLSEEIVEHAYRDDSNQTPENPAERFRIPNESLSEQKLTNEQTVEEPFEVTDEMAETTFSEFLDTLDVPVPEEVARGTYSDFIDTIPGLQSHKEQAMAAFDRYIDNELAPALEEMEVMTWSEVLDLEEVIPGSNIILGFETDSPAGPAHMVLRAEHLSDELTETYECWSYFTAKELKQIIREQAGDVEIEKIGRVILTANPSLEAAIQMEIEIAPNIYQAVELPAPIMIGNTATDSIKSYLEKKRNAKETDESEE